MAVGSNATNTKRLTRSGIADSFSFASGFSFGIHFRYTTNSSTFLTLNTSPTGSGEITHGIDGSGNLVSWHDGNMVNFGAVSAGAWYFTGHSISGTSGTRYFGASGSTPSNAARTMTSFTIGQLGVLVNAHFNTEPFDGYVAGFWVAPRALSQPEMEHYARTMLGPKDAWCSWPMLDTNTYLVDFGVNGRNATGGGTTPDSTASNPAVGWGRSGKRRVWFVPSGGGSVTGTIAVTEPNDAMAASGSVGVNGSIATTEPGDTMAAGGAVGVNGSVATVEPIDSCSATGTFSTGGVTGTIAVTEPADSASISGAVGVVGSISATESVDVSSISATVPDACRVNIFNLALSRIGVKNLMVSLGDDSIEADLCAELYDRALDTVLATYPWPFATKRAELVAASSEGHTGWSRCYTLPSDCVSPRYIYPFQRAPTSEWRIPFELQSNDAGDGVILVTDLDEPELIYTARVTDCGAYPPPFVDALAWFLAAELAMPLAVRPDLRAQAMAMWEAMRSRAEAASANEAHEAAPLSSLLSVRGYELPVEPEDDE